MNAQLVMDFAVLAKRSVTNYKILDMNFYLTMCLHAMYVTVWDIK